MLLKFWTPILVIFTLSLVQFKQITQVKAENFQSELQIAANNHNWKETIRITDIMIKLYSDNQDYVEKLKLYRAKLVSYLAGNSTESPVVYDNLTNECQQLLNSKTSFPPIEALAYYQAEAYAGRGIESNDMDLIFKLMDKASAEFQLENYRGAALVYLKILEINRHDPSAWEGIGYVLVKVGKYQDALGAFDRATESEAAVGIIDTEYRGLTQCVLGNYQEARNDLETHFEKEGGIDFEVKNIIIELRKRT